MSMTDALPIGTWLVQLTDKGNRMTRLFGPSALEAQAAIVAHEDRLCAAITLACADGWSPAHALDAVRRELAKIVEEETKA